MLSQLCWNFTSQQLVFICCWWILSTVETRETSYLEVEDFGFVWRVFEHVIILIWMYHLPIMITISDMRTKGWETQEMENRTWDITTAQMGTVWLWSTPIFAPRVNLLYRKKSKNPHTYKRVCLFSESIGFSFWKACINKPVQDKNRGQFTKALKHRSSNSVSVSPNAHSGQQKLTDESNRVRQLANLQGHSSDYRNTKTFKTGSLFM